MSNVETRYANDAFTTIVNATLNPADTLITVSDGSNFPTIGSGQHFYSTLEDNAGQVEIVKCTIHTSASAQFTVLRGQDNTAALTFIAGDYFEMRPNSEVFEELRDHTHTGEYSVEGHNHDGSYLKLSGGTVTGPIIGVDSTNDAHLTRTDFVNDQLMTRPETNNKNVRLSSEIPSSNADSIIVSGFYKVDATISNVPGTKIGMLSHFSEGSLRHWQIYRESFSSDTHTRTYDSGVWRSWQRVVRDDDYAIATRGGSIKILQDGADLYITTNGSDAVIIP